MKETVARCLALLLLDPLLGLHAGTLPDFSSDVAADQWLRKASPAYLRMAEFVDQKCGYEFGMGTNWAGGLAYVKDGKFYLKTDVQRKSLKWFLFHKAAYEQRKSLQDKIPEVWLCS